jgi:type VI secretion system protein ImpF
VDLERVVKQAIRDFEPRIDPATLEVEAIASEAFLDRHNVITIQIHGTLWAQPVPLEILLRTDVNLETGEVRVEEVGRGG